MEMDICHLLMTICLGDKSAEGKGVLLFGFCHEENNDKAILRKINSSARVMSCVILVKLERPYHGLQCRNSVVDLNGESNYMASWSCDSLGCMLSIVTSLIFDYYGVLN